MSIKFINKGGGKTKLPNGTKFVNSTFTTFDINTFDVSELTTFDNMFANCKNLTNAIISNNTNISSFSSMFSGCTALISIDLSNVISTSHLNTMFSNCKALTSIDFNNSSIKGIEFRSMFANCTALTTIDLKNITIDNTSTSTQGVNSMFANCTALINVDISHFNLSNFTFFNSSTDMIKGCLNLSDNSLNSILKALSTSGVNVPAYKNLKEVGFTEEQANKAINLSNWTLCEANGWTTGY